MLEYMEYTPPVAAFCTDAVTIAELRHVDEVVWWIGRDPRNGRRSVTPTPYRTAEATYLSTQGLSPLASRIDG